MIVIIIIIIIIISGAVHPRRRGDGLLRAPFGKELGKEQMGSALNISALWYIELYMGSAAY